MQIHSDVHNRNCVVIVWSSFMCCCIANCHWTWWRTWCHLL